LVCYGGAGPLHSCAIAEISGIRRLVVTPLSAVFSAYSSSLMDVGHVYYHRLGSRLESDGDHGALDRALGDMRLRAERDMRGEGFGADRVRWHLELIVSDGGKEEAKLQAPVDFYRNPDALAAVRKRATLLLKLPETSPLVLSTVGLFCRAEVPHYRLRPVPAATHPVSDCQRGHRRVYLGPVEGFAELPLYERERMGNGHRVTGPAIVESRQTTMVVPTGWTLAVDSYDNAMVERS
jgi:N-methylhydantoinase A/oxoprolinase/acetone carboxylase beta subunit